MDEEKLINSQMSQKYVLILLLQVWEQCGFEAEYKLDMGAFRRAVTENGTLLHPFLVARIETLCVTV